jgi:hypothetical protein
VPEALARFAVVITVIEREFGFVDIPIHSISTHGLYQSEDSA